MPEARRFPLPLLVAAAGLVGITVLTTFLLYRRSTPATPSAGVNRVEEQRQYLSQVEVSGSGLSAAENFLGQTVTSVDVQLSNRGGRILKLVELQFEFLDTLNQVVLRETVRPVHRRTPPLRPLESRTFRASFERLPIDWNRALPLIHVARVEW